MGATLNRGKSKQDYATPWDFIRAVEAEHGPIGFDLAASADNAKHERYFTEADDALTKDWHKLGNELLWLNPPFGQIAPWAKKAREETILGANIAMLTPASVSSEWFAKFVYPAAMVYPVRPRIVFEGAKDPYPKDLMLSIFRGGACHFLPWRWK